jgi:hypothetical protein
MYSTLYNKEQKEIKTERFLLSTWYEWQAHQLFSTFADTQTIKTAMGFPMGSYCLTSYSTNNSLYI